MCWQRGLPRICLPELVLATWPNIIEELYASNAYLLHRDRQVVLRDASRVKLEKNSHVRLALIQKIPKRNHMTSSMLLVNQAVHDGFGDGNVEEPPRACQSYLQMARGRFDTTLLFTSRAEHSTGLTTSGIT